MCYVNAGAAHAEGDHTSTTADAAHSEGGYTVASGQYSHAEGGQTEAKGIASHAEGLVTRAISNHSHTEGYYTFAFDSGSHAEGSGSITNGIYSHVEGINCIVGMSLDNGNITNYTASIVGNYTDKYFINDIVRIYNGSRIPIDDGIIISNPIFLLGSTKFIISSSVSGPGAYGVSKPYFGEGSHAEGIGTQVLGTGSLVAGYFNRNDSDYSAILAGQNNLLEYTANRSVILGGQNITGSLADTAYLPNVHIGTIGTGSSIYNLGIDSN
mgnify:FL=1